MKLLWSLGVASSRLKPGSRYHRSMTGSLEKAVRRAENLSPEEQDALAAQIMESLDDEEAWVRRFREDSSMLQSLAKEAMEEHRRGETRAYTDVV